MKPQEYSLYKPTVKAFKKTFNKIFNKNKNKNIKKILLQDLNMENKFLIIQFKEMF